MTFPPKVWDGVLRRLQARVAPISFDRWLSEIDAAQVDETLELRCPTQFHRDRIREYFYSTIEDCVCEELGHRVPLRIEVVRPDSLEAPSQVDRIPAAAVSSNLTTDSICAVESNQTHLLARQGGGHVGDAHQAVAPVARSTGSASGDRRLIQSRREVEGVKKRNSVPNMPGQNKSDRRSEETLHLDRALDMTMSQLRPTVPGPESRGLAELGPSCADASATRRNGESNTKSRRNAERPPNYGAAARDRQTKAPHEKAFAAATPNERFRQPVFPLTFETFAVGSCNALAREAAFAIASRKHLSLNQLFLTSAPGLGKTHLARAVAIEAKRILGERARYTTAESFTNEFTQALRGGQMARFKRKYRNDCDLLIFEDIQFLEGKDATQLEFFHTVQHVLDCGGRVLLTGDRFPQEYQNLDPRVRARIANGFVAEMEPPDETVRRNILRSKAAHGGLRLPDDCLGMLVESVKGNVRELEGALIQLVTMASLLKRPIDLELTQQSVHGRTPRPKTPDMRATPGDVIKVVALFFKTTPELLASRSRRGDVLLPRQLAMYLCRRYTDASLAEIGKSFDRDHPSVANAIRKVERQVLENVRLRYRVESLIGRLDELGFKPLHSFK